MNNLPMNHHQLTDPSHRQMAVAVAFLLALGLTVRLEAGGSVVLNPDDTSDACAAKAAQVAPSARQVAWQRADFTAFVHFGMDTFTDREWGQGTEDPKLFNPTALDARQWVTAAKAAGIQGLILTAKHHDGFCLWPTRFTEHCVRNSPWKKGRGDVVREFSDACRDAGLRFGIYLSPWDRHELSYGDSPRYNEFYLNQLRELLTQYPGISEVWFDGACGEGPNGKKQVYDWRAYWSLIRQLAPDAVISVRGPDVRWCGNEAGRPRQSEWSVIPLSGADADDWAVSDPTLRAFDVDIHGEDLGSRAALFRARAHRPRLVWFPAQVDVSIRPGWFFHPAQNNQVKSLEELITIYFGAVGGNGQLLLNVPADPRGLFYENDVARLYQLGGFLRQSFATNFARDASVSAEVVGGTSVGVNASVCDGDADTFWTTSEQPLAASLTFELGMARRFNCALLQEHLPSGQRVEAFTLEIRAGNTWKEIARSTTIGHKRLLRFDEVTTDAVRVKFPAFRGRPTLAEFGLFETPAMLAAPQFQRDLDGTVTIQKPSGTEVHYTLDGSEPTEAAPVYTQPIPLRLGGVFNARTFAIAASASLALGGEPVMRQEFGLAKRKWKLVEVDSEQPPDEAGRMAFDENPDTLWHSKYRGGEEPLPHHLTVDLGEQISIRGFTYLPRQDPSDNGVVVRGRFETSTDGQEWVNVTGDTRFDNIRNGRLLQVMRLNRPAPARYVRFTALESAGSNRLVSAAELGVLAVPERSGTTR